jgi:hypothetical protein
LLLSLFLLSFALFEVRIKGPTFHGRKSMSVLSFALLGLACLLQPHASLALAAAPEDLEPWLIKTRRDLHRIPELGFQEHLTSKYIRKALEAMNITYQ